MQQIHHNVKFSSVQSLSHIQLFVTSWTAARQAPLSIINSWSLLKLMSIELVMPSNHLILCYHLLLPSIFPSIRVFSNELVLCIRWPKCWSFSFSISFSNEYSGLISFRMDCLDLFAVQGSLKSLLQHHSSKASILQCSAFFIVQLSHPYMTRWTFVVKVMSLLFNMLSRFSFKEQASFNSMAAVTICSDFGAQKNKVCHCFHCFPIYLPWSDATRCHDLSFWMLSFKSTFSLSSFTFIKRLFSSSSLSAISVVSSAYLRLLIFFPAILNPVWASLVAQLVKNLPAMGLIPGLGRSLAEGKATLSSIMAWRIPWTALSMGSQIVGHNWATNNNSKIKKSYVNIRNNVKNCG